MFGDLHEKYNTYPAPVQEWRAFYLDVNEIATEARDRDKFVKRLSTRRDKRRKDLRDTGIARTLPRSGRT